MEESTVTPDRPNDIVLFETKYFAAVFEDFYSKALDFDGKLRVIMILEALTECSIDPDAIDELFFRTLEKLEGEITQDGKHVSELCRLVNFLMGSSNFDFCDRARELIVEVASKDDVLEIEPWHALTLEDLIEPSNPPQFVEAFAKILTLAVDAVVYKDSDDEGQEGGDVAGLVELFRLSTLFYEVAGHDLLDYSGWSKDLLGASTKIDHCEEIADNWLSACEQSIHQLDSAESEELYTILKSAKMPISLASRCQDLMDDLWAKA